MYDTGMAEIAADYATTGTSRNPTSAGVVFDDPDDVIWEALAGMSVPALMMTMVHMTGDLDLLQELPVPSQTIPNDLQGGMSETDKEKVRLRAFDVIRGYRDRGCPAPFEPDMAQLKTMAETVTAGPVSDEYLDYIAADLQLSNATGFEVDLRSRAEDRAALPVVVIGCGQSGVLAGVRLTDAGIPFTIVERQPDVGGSWQMNRYPGARVDINTHYYSYSFQPNLAWKHDYSEQPEIVSYLREVLDTNGVTPHVRFSTEVVSARWDEDSATWSVELRDQHGIRETLTARALISAVGQFSRPIIPNIQGRDAFGGPAFHTSAWNDDVDLRGKRVAVIGAGATGFQLVPAIVDVAASVVVYQRSAQWIFPNPGYHDEVTDGDRWARKKLPFYGRWLRFVYWWPINDGAADSVVVDPNWQDGGRSISEINAYVRDLFQQWIAEQIHDPELMDKVIPDYPPMGKRMLQDNGTWLATLQRDNVELVRTNIDRLTADGVTTVDGVHRQADIVVWATGFDVNRQLDNLHIIGRGDQDLNAVWGEEPRAYLGITVPDFPNLFCMYGPGTNAVNGASIVYLSECQMCYIMGCLDMIAADGIAAMEPRRDVHNRYTQRHTDALNNLVYAHPSVNSYYQNSKGETPTLFPWRIIDYWAWTRKPNTDDFALTNK